MRRRLSGWLGSGLAAILLTASAAQAALPPYWQSAREITAILEDGSVHDALKYEEPIISIGLQEPLSDDRVYVLKTSRCTLLIGIAYKPSQTAGAAQFDIEVGKADCQ